MNLDEITNGSRILLDANICIYAGLGASEECRSIIDKCASGILQGFITSIIAAECCHRWMVAEAREKGLVGAGNPTRSLSEKGKSALSQLNKYPEKVLGLIHGNIKLEPVEGPDFLVGLKLQKQWGLLTNDSLNLAVAERLGIFAIVTADKGMHSVEGFRFFNPSDLAI